MASSQQPQPSLATPSDEDYNEPSQERQEVLQRLQNAIGDVPVRFWAACHVCDLGELVNLTEIKPSAIYTFVCMELSTENFLSLLLLLSPSFYSSTPSFLLSSRFSDIAFLCSPEEIVSPVCGGRDEIGLCRQIRHVTSTGAHFCFRPIHVLVSLHAACQG